MQPRMDHQAYTEGILGLLQGKTGRQDPSLVMLLRVLDSIYDGIVVVDRNSRIIFANQGYQRILGVPVAKVLGRRLAEIEPEAGILKTLTTGTSLLYGFVQVNSVHKQLVCNHTPVYDEAGNLLGAVATFLDAADRERRTTETTGTLGQANWTVERAVGTADVPDPLELPVPFRRLLGKSVKFLEALSRAYRVARSDCTVLIRGESGVGKELLARAIHEESRRCQGPLVTVNCGAIPEALLESELFGYEEGAFTGAQRGGKPGKFELAHGGTIFLDEVGEMSQTMQVKLLRVLQERWVERVGAVKGRAVDVRVLAATNRDLEGMMAKGQFREDIYYRLSVVPLVLPSLRERRDDVVLLAESFLMRTARGRGEAPELSRAAQEVLFRYDWPGNVRELENALEYAAVMAPGGQILPEHLPERVLQAVGRSEAPARRQPLKGLMNATERRAIQEALNQVGGNHTRAIELLGISRGAFYKKLRAYGLADGPAAPR